MEAKELMLGDWVYNALYADAEIPNKGHGWKSVRVQHIPFDEDWAIAPIPLTEKILKVNGFDIVQDGDSLTIWKQKDDEYGNEVYDITIYASKDIIRFDTSIRYHGAIRKNIYYVHELQHTLRICGLNDLADNFKIGGEE